MLNRQLLLGLVLLVLAAPAVKAQSLLWKVSGNGLEQPSYLYGTMHIPDERVYDFTDEFYNAWESVEVVALELKLNMETQAKVMQLLQLPEDQKLSELLDEKDYNRIDEIMQDKMGMPLDVYNRFQPIFVWMMLHQASTIKETMELRKQGIQPLDKGLNDAAEHADKTVVGLETPESQAKIFTDVPQDKQIETLLKAIDDLESGEADDMMDKMLEIYVDGDLKALMNLFAEHEGLETDMMDELLTKRNIKMVEGAIDLFHEQPTMVAVGAAHLGGKDGLIPLLREEDYTVEAVIGEKVERVLEGARLPVEEEKDK